MAETVPCGQCGALVPSDHQFCGQCGATTAAGGPLTTGSQRAVETPCPRLVLIRGEGVDGTSFRLEGAEYSCGRTSGDIRFPQDVFLSPRHATFLHQNGRLFVRDDGSLNGLYIRIRGTISLSPGSIFMAGEQILVVETADPGGQMVANDQTHFFASPRPGRPWRLRQVLESGRPGLCHYVRGDRVSIGRDGCDLDFGDDRFISGRHCQVDFAIGAISLTDLDSRNGSYLRVSGTRELNHGDYIFLGKQLLRVEMPGKGKAA